MDINILPPYDFLKGALIPIDKPLEWTSFDVVNKLRYQLRQKLGIKKIKVGHTGTLDPLATGLLLIATGKMTKRIQELTDLSKVYSGEIQLGATTPTYDRESEVDAHYPTNHLNRDLIFETIESMKGEMIQEVPIYSAVKKGGRKMYEYARKNIEVERPKRKIMIDQFDLLDYNSEDHSLKFRVACSKGTYIRTLAVDLGKKLISGAYLSALKRENIGQYSIDQAFSIDSFIMKLENGSLEN